MLRLTQSIIQPSIRAFAVLAFAANVNAQWSAVDTFEGAKLSTMWRHTNGVALRNTGGAKGTRGFASLGKHGDMLEGRLTAAGASPVGLSDFYVELYFRVRNTTNQRFNLQIGGAELGGSARAPLNICYTAQTGWCLAAKPDGLNFPQSGLAVGPVKPEAWHRFRFTGRDWGESNACYEMQLSGPDGSNFTTSTTNRVVDQAGNFFQPPALAYSFALSSAGGNNPGFDVDEVSAGVITPYKGPVVTGVDTKTLSGKVMCGYQGWFGAPGDGSSGHGWRHWVKGNGPLADGNAKVDFWPEVTELASDDRFATGFKTADGRPAEVFSSFKRTTVSKHFQWMQDYGIDGVFVQRFVSDLRGRSSLEHCNTVLANCRAGANLHGRAYAVMYDLSGLQAGHIDEVINDWRTLRRQMVVTEDPAYLRHRAKPVVAVWGVGFTDRRYTLAECRRLVEFLKHDPEAGGCTVMLGVPAHWRESGNDAVSDPMLLEVLGLADIISPWTVGRYTNPAAAAKYGVELLKPDLTWCQQRGIEYLPVVFPGFSWHNMYGATFDQIPRLRGQFLWAQFCAAKRANASMIYVAMFDEVDEGTAIFKCSNDVPAGHTSKFLTFEGLPSDHYLKLVGAGTKLLRGEIPLQDAPPF